MDKSIATIDWAHWQAFAAVAEEGSLSAGARKLGLSQPTLGRHVRALEEALGVTLFRRQSRGLSLSEAGLELLPSAKAMQEAAGRLALTAAGRATDVAGTVRLTASAFVSMHILPPILADLRQSEPEIQIELVPSDLSQNLLFREADIAIRMYRPEQLDVITRHLGDVELGLFGATAYLDRHGRPERIEDLRAHDLIGYDTDETLLRGMRQIGLPAEREWFALRCDDHNVLWELVRAGCGLGFAQASVGRTAPEVESVLPQLPLPTLPVWLAAAEEMRRSPRIRRVWNHLAESLQAVLMSPRPHGS